MRGRPVEQVVITVLIPTNIAISEPNRVMRGPIRSSSRGGFLGPPRFGRAASL